MGVSSRQEQLLAILDRLLVNIGTDVTGAAIVSADGIILAARMSNELNVDRVGAVAATILGVTRRAAGELRIGLAEEMIIKADNGFFMLLPSGDQSLTAVNLRQGANLGLARIEAREAAESISRVLQPLLNSRIEYSISPTV